MKDFAMRRDLSLSLSPQGYKCALAYEERELVY